MVSLTHTAKEYDSLTTVEKRQVFEDLANRILSVHPEYLEETRTKDFKEIVTEIKEETEDIHVVTKKDNRNIKRLVKRMRK